jgi:selenocysteine lyase/cysteine desulfurase
MQGGKPIEENWINRKDSHQFQNLVNYQESYSPGHGRYSVGEQSNFILLPMLNAALKQVIAWGIPDIQDYCKNLNEPFLEELESLGFKVLKEGQMSNHLLGIQIPKHIDEQSLKQTYQDHKVVVSFRGQSIRISPNVYNDHSDWERLIEVTEAIL